MSDGLVIILLLIVIEYKSYLKTSCPFLLSMYFFSYLINIILKKVSEIIFLPFLIVIKEFSFICSLCGLAFFARVFQSNELLQESVFNKVKNLSKAYL